MRQQDFAIANPRPPSIPRFAIVSLDPQLPQRRASGAGAVRSVDGARLAGERAAAEDEPIFIRVVAVCCRAPESPTEQRHRRYHRAAARARRSRVNK